MLFLAVGIFLPSKRHLERSITINAPASVVFGEVNNFRNWQKWSPWLDLDPEATVKYEGPEEGVGSAMIWASDHPEIGKGSQKIILSDPNRHIICRLDFADWEGKVTAGWKFEALTAHKTRVTWTNDSDSKGKIFYKYINVMIYSKLGKTYVRGLQSLKTHVESIYQ